ncbi:MAG: hypothetical protein ACOC3V_00290 [bacterium]
MNEIIENKKELTDDEKKEIYIQELKNSRIKFKNTSHVGNFTTTKFDKVYKKKRQKRNKLAKNSRKNNRKK